MPAHRPLTRRPAAGLQGAPSPSQSLCLSRLSPLDLRRAVAAAGGGCWRRGCSLSLPPRWR
jgi:hypothetical protein